MPKLSEKIPCKCGCKKMFLRKHAVERYATAKCKKRGKAASNERARNKAKAKRAKSKASPKVTEMADHETTRELRARRATKLKSAYENIVLGHAQLAILQFEEVVDEYVLNPDIGLEQVSELLQARTKESAAVGAGTLLLPALSS
jgi:hypothetical protein